MTHTPRTHDFRSVTTRWRARAVLVLVVAVTACEAPTSGPDSAASLPCLGEVPRPEGLLLAGSGTNLPLVRRIVRAYEDAEPS